MPRKIAKEKNSFWKGLPRPFFVLAPMANVTDFAFRSIISKYGKPDVIWTEFVSADGIISPGRKILLNDLKFSKKEKPIVAQLFSAHPEAMEKAVFMVAKMGFDGVDLNMGCPDRAVEKQGSGASLIKKPDLALEILKAARQGWRRGKKLKKEILDCEIPVSIKTRIGYSEFEPEWIRTLLKEKLPALSIHLRTRKEMSEVEAHWDLMPEIIKMRDQISPETLVIGNGDVKSVQEGLEYASKYGCDGIMIGRGIFGKPWFFEGLDKSRSGKRFTPKEKDPKFRLKALLEHARLFDRAFKGIKNFDTMKKHFKAYVSGWDGAKELRVKLMETDNFGQTKKAIDEFLRKGQI